MCREYKLACLNWWVICYPASTVNLMWFADDNFLKFYSCSHKNSAKQLHLCVFGDSLTFAYLSKTMHQHAELARQLSFWLERHLTSELQPPCSMLSADMMKMFSSANQIKFTVESG